MGRWEPGAAGRLQQAAAELFAERGYAEVTVAEIADRAGLTKRTFFNHFTDKREVLFAGAEAFQTSVMSHLSDTGQELPPIAAAVRALTRAGRELSQYSDYASARRSLIASSTELQERELMKMTALTSAIAEALRERHLTTRAAELTAHAAITVFITAFGDWSENTGEDLEALMQRSLTELRHVVTGDPPRHPSSSR